MVKLVGPGLAQEASGSLSETLIFSSCKGRAYLKKHAKPKQPRSDSQISMRAQLSFLSKSWHTWSQVVRDTWLPIAAQTNVSPFNAFISFNQDRHRSGLAPCISPTPTFMGDAQIVDNAEINPGIRKLEIRYRVADVRQGWGIQTHIVSNTGVQPVWHQMIHCMDHRSVGWKTHVITPFPAGTYWFTFIWHTYTAKMNAASWWLQQTVLD